MPTLCEMIRPSSSRVGFLLPLFREFAGSNHLVTQQVDVLDNVVGFQPTFLGEGGEIPPHNQYEVEVGNPALWCFGLPDGSTLVGPAEHIQAEGLEILGSGVLEKHPMAAADLAAFCRAEVEFPETILAAFHAASKLSRKTAEIWRDAVVLLPHIRDDLSQSLGSLDEVEPLIRRVLCVSRGGVSHIFIPSRLIGAGPLRLDRWRRVAKVFGIQRYEVHEAKSFEQRAEPVPFLWRLVGTGGVGRWTVRNAPFKGVLRTSTVSNDKFAVSETPLLPGEVHSPPLIVAIVGSDYDNIKVAERAALIRGSWPTLKHAIMVRPMGFGTPRPNKLRPQQLPSLLPTFDYFWLIANHRKRKPVETRQNMATSRIASRYAKDAALALIELHSARGRLPNLNETIASRRFGLVGATKFHANIDEYDGRPEELIRRALASAVTEDAYLHSAKRFTALWPARDRARPTHVTVKLGRHRYKVDVFPCENRVTEKDVILLAQDVKLAANTPKDFQDFVVTLMSQFFWRERHQTPENLLFEDEGEALRVWPVIDRRTLNTLVRREAEFGSPSDLIITNQSISSHVARQARERGWQLIHYSTLHQWMAEHYPENAIEADEERPPERSGDIWG